MTMEEKRFKLNVVGGYHWICNYIIFGKYIEKKKKIY